MEVIDMQTSFFPSIGQQATYIIYKKDDGRYKVTVKVGDETDSCEWGMLSLCYDWAVGHMMMRYGVGA